MRSFSYPVAIGAVAWITFISIAFILPQINVSALTFIYIKLWADIKEQKPVDSQTLNYSVVAVGVVVLYSVGFWLLSARKWFTGPVKQIAGECMRCLT